MLSGRNLYQKENTAELTESFGDSICVQGIDADGAVQTVSGRLYHYTSFLENIGACSREQGNVL